MAIFSTQAIFNPGYLISYGIYLAALTYSEFGPKSGLFSEIWLFLEPLMALGFIIAGIVRLAIGAECSWVSCWPLAVLFQGCAIMGIMLYKRYRSTIKRTIRGIKVQLASFRDRQLR